MTYKKQHDVSPISIPLTGTVRDVVGLFATHKPAQTGLPAGIALIVDESGALSGIVTHGDLVRALAKKTPEDTPVSEIMNPNPFVVVAPESGQDIIAAVVKKNREEHLHKNRLEKIIIVDAKGVVQNVVSFFDVWQSSDVSYKHVGIVGLGYVGLTLGLTLADLGFYVKGFDINESVKNTIRDGKAPFYEEGLIPLLAEHNGDHFKIVDDFDDEHNCDVYFIAVGTPLDPDKKPKLNFIERAAADIGKVLKNGDLVILRSTVPLGVTRSVVIPALERESGLVAGDDFFVAFAPERTIEGKALQELRILPQVIGGVNRQSANVAASVFNYMTNAIHIVDTLEEAEIVKLINNTYRDVMFGFANEIALICQKWGIDTNKVISAANAGYPRSNVPKPSPGVGGYCLEKDPHILMHGAREKGYEPRIIEHARAANEKILDALAEDMLAYLRQEKGGREPKLFILGFAFKGKPATSDLRGSTTVSLVRKIKDAGYGNIFGYDPVVSEQELEKLDIAVVTNLEDGFRDADAVIVMNNHESFERLDIHGLMKSASDKVLFYDTWALYDKESAGKREGIDYRRL